MKSENFGIWLTVSDVSQLILIKFSNDIDLLLK